MQKHLSADIYGLVQGVGFRYATYSWAQKYAIVGSVKNCTNGSVHLEAQGEALQLEHFIKIIQNGPNKFAHVKQMQLQEQPLSNFSEFLML
ncbi:acylphosphatase [Bombilactobacillus folatiphilus]|uniref:acylphosphatase n=1 Tax=Bombilactobacillus folatiphilus TaxID=2923362 RepID=A0ABY4PA53_9LACO|nr:acylphosphatase [Bombilactobacillus folatiphilus]UQS82553.1 acylphosphatase [Bombilactobacillus folatiphilus]